MWGDFCLIGNLLDDLSMDDEIRFLRQYTKTNLVHWIKLLAEQKNMRLGVNLMNRSPDVNIMSRSPDVEVLFEFNGTREHPAFDGYRPAHLVVEDYLTTGIHHYYKVDAVAPDGTAKGTITFLTPEAYPHSLWIGKRINIQEGARIVGYATVTEIYNPLLQAECER